MAKLERLNLTAKVHGIRPATLLAFVEPPRGLRKGSPVQAFAALTAQLQHYREVRPALVELFTEKAVVDLEPRRRRLAEFFQNLSGLSLPQRLEQKEGLSHELQQQLNDWPNLTPELVAPCLQRLESLCERMLGDRWFVPTFDDAQHRTVVERPHKPAAKFSVEQQLREQGFRSDSASPLQHFLLCPQACGRCWGRLLDRLRDAKQALGFPPLHPIQDSIVELLRKSNGRLLTKAVVERTVASQQCAESTAYEHLKQLLQIGLIHQEPLGGRGTLTTLA